MLQRILKRNIIGSRDTERRGHSWLKRVIGTTVPINHLDRLSQRFRLPTFGMKRELEEGGDELHE